MFANKKYIIFGIISFILLTVLVILFIFFSATKQETLNYSQNLETIKATDEEMVNLELIASKDDLILGNVNAPIQIISYDSFSCIHCSNFFVNVFPEIKKNFIDTGKVSFVHRDFPLDVQSLTATKLTKCFAKNHSSEETFKIVSAIYASQKDWLSGDGYTEKLSQIFEFVGYGSKEIAECLKDEELENRILEDRLKASKTLKINGTPTFFINGERFKKDYSIYSFQSEIESLLEK